MNEWQLMDRFEQQNGTSNLQAIKQPVFVLEISLSW
jgi:hypothetical protein